MQVFRLTVLRIVGEYIKGNLCGVCLWLLSALAVAADGGEVKTFEVVKSPLDTRRYEYLVLENQLRVLLISDPASDKGAAAMDVHVGYHDDPADRAGLAHFLEHMLFLGTEKYPQAGAYQEFITSHGGSHNAYTAGEHTNYFFDVEQVHLEKALDRFAQFFIAPSFTPEYVDRERNAVNSEYRARYRDDYRRRHDVLAEIVRQQHPLSKFNVGSLETLADREDDPVREDLLNFYRDYYSASNMALVVLGREPLLELRDMVIHRFSRIPLREVKPQVRGEQLFAEDALPLAVNVKPLQTVRQLTLSFPMPVGESDYRSKPLAYLGGILGHEGEGSLLSLLKQQGWAEALSAGGNMNERNQETFDISISLTESGLREREKVVAAVFEMIDRLRHKGIEKWRYREQSQLADISFRFAEKREPIHTVSRLANDMHEFMPADILRGNYAFDEYDAKLIRDCLQYLRPDNLLLVLMAPEAETDQLSPHYATPYRVRPLAAAEVQLTRSQRRALKLPDRNRFIPQQLKLKPKQQQAELPQKIVASDAMQAWYMQVDRFQIPRSSVRLRIFSPLVSSGVRQAAMSQLYAALVSDQLNEYAYPAHLAGLSFSVKSQSRGFDVSVDGYNDKQALLFSRIVETLANADIQPERFRSLRQELLRNWRNQPQLTPYQQLFRKLPVILYSPYWDQLDMAAALESVTVEQLRDFASRVWVNTHLQMLTMGNVLGPEARELASLAERHLHIADQQAAPSLAPARVVDLPEGLLQVHVPVEHQDVAAMLYLQAQSDSAEDRAGMMMLRQMLSSGFYHELRTEKQLGYVVFLTDFELKDVVGSVFVVQSPSASLADVMDEISSFVQKSAGSISDFELYRRAVLAELTEAPRNLNELIDRYWLEILSNAEQFDRRQKLIAALEALTPEQLVSYSARVLGRPDGLWISASAVENVEARAPSVRSTGLFDFQEFKDNARVFTYQ